MEQAPPTQTVDLEPLEVDDPEKRIAEINEMIKAVSARAGGLYKEWEVSCKRIEALNRFRHRIQLAQFKATKLPYASKEKLKKVHADQIAAELEKKEKN